MLMSQPNYLVPQDSGSVVLEPLLGTMFTAHNVAVGSADTVSLQPAFSTKLLATLPEDQALAASHAKTFLNGWGFGVASTFVAGMGSVATLAINLLQTGMASAAKDLDQGSPGSASFESRLGDFRAYLSTLGNSCCSLDPDSSSLLLPMASIRDQLDTLSGYISDDDTRLATAIKEVDTDGTIAGLLQQQSALQEQFAENNRKIADGAVSTIPGDIEFGFSFAKEFLDGVTTGAIAGAALDVIGEVDQLEAFDKATKELRDQQSQLGAKIVALMETIAQDQQEKTELTLVAAQVDILSQNIKTLLAETGAILSQMTNWKLQIDLLSEQSTPPTAGFYSNQVSAGLDFWSGIAQSTNRYRSILAQTSR